MNINIYVEMLANNADVYSSLFVAFTDQIFISPDELSFNRTYSCTIHLGYGTTLNTSDFIL